MLTPGQTVGSYELVRKLGGGAFGEVWLARHVELGAECALKIPTDPDYVRQLRKEGQIQFGLKHPNIVGTVDLNTLHDPPYFVMEYVEGTDLRKYLTACGKLRLAEAMGIVGQILEALKAAHAKGVLHRDLKPENVLRTPDGAVKVTDFGLGKVQADVAQSLLLSGSMMSREGKSVSGTFAYMSPEQASGEPPDPRDDLYAVGILGCELLTGSRPLPGISTEDQFDDAGIHRDHALVFQRALALPKRRYATAAEMRAAVQAAEAAEEARTEADRLLALRREQKERERRERARRKHLAVGACIAVGLLLLVVLLASTVMRLVGLYPAEARRRQEEAARAAGVPVEKDFDLGNGVQMTMVFIPAGSFDMGSPENEPNRGSDETLHRVTISKPFWMGKYEVTQEQWQAVMGNSLSNFKGPKLPVETVSWDDCQQFLSRLNQKHPGKIFRLPTEAEWEYACRAGTTTAYQWGDDPDGGAGWCNAADQAAKRQNPGWTVFSWDDGYANTAPVGSFRANAWGLFDMHGNVWEWCQDWYGPYQAGAQTDPGGAPNGKDRVARGGSWYRPPGLVRSAYRLWVHPGLRNWSVGFRVVLAPGPP